MSKNKADNNINESKTNRICHCGDKDCALHSELLALRDEVVNLRSQVIRDFLTGLYNSRHLEFCLNQEFERTLRSRQPTTLIMLDIDFFKKVNDTYGHTVGDVVLKQVANTLVGSVRKLDVCCRYGGEEFMIILPSTHQLVGTQVAERIRKNIEALDIHLTEGDIKITASFGVNTFQYNSEMQAEAFIKSVDEQLYRAKAAGRNCVFSATQEKQTTPHVTADERSALFGDDSDKP